MERNADNPYKADLHAAYKSLKKHIKGRVFILGIAIGNKDGSDEMVVWRTGKTRLHVGIHFIDRAFENKKVDAKHGTEVMIEKHEIY